MMETWLGQVAHIVAECEGGQEEKTNNFVGSIDTSIEQLRNRASELRTARTSASSTATPR